MKANLKRIKTRSDLKLKYHDGVDSMLRICAMCDY